MASPALTVSLALATAQATGGSGSDTLDSIENLTGIQLTPTRSPAPATAGANDTSTAAAGSTR
jgi:hypothetical protein